MILINGERTFTTEFQPPSDEKIDTIFGPTRGIVAMGHYEEDNSLYQKTLATLNKKELLKFVDDCLSYKAEHHYDLCFQNCRHFVLSARKLLSDNGKVLHEKMNAFSNQLQEILRHERIMPNMSEEAACDVGGRVMRSAVQ